MEFTAQFAPRQIEGPHVFRAISGRPSGNDYHASNTNAILPTASSTSYFPSLNRFKREEATFFTDSTANGRIL
jgi:hypothetical protein